MLSWALPQARNCLSWFAIDENFYTEVPPEWRQTFKEQYQVAQLIHSLSHTVLEEEFKPHDIWFLNHDARFFFERNNEQTCSSHPLFAYFIQELFKAVPEDKRRELQWDGPQGDFAWARPRSGNEPGVLP